MVSASKLEYLRPTDLKPNPENPRRNDHAVPAVADSIKRFGFNAPVLLDKDGQVIAGHTRLKAALYLGLETVPCLRLPHLSPTEAKAYGIADNKTGEIADWDEDLLLKIVKELQDEDASLVGSLGFQGKDLNDLIAALKGLETDGSKEDEVPDPPAVPITQPGDIWICGDHRIACGDSTDPSIVAKLLNGIAPFMMVTDPPYGVEYEPGWRAEKGLHASDGRVGDVTNDDQADWSRAMCLFAGNVAYVWHSATCIIAAEKTGRRCLAMEIEPKWVDVCVQRWEQYTGKKATRNPA